MRNNNYWSLINFKGKLHRRRLKMNTMLDVQFFGDVVDIVSRRVLERHVGCCNHGSSSELKNTSKLVLSHCINI